MVDLDITLATDASFCLSRRAITAPGTSGPCGGRSRMQKRRRRRNAVAPLPPAFGGAASGRSSVDAPVSL